LGAGLLDPIEIDYHSHVEMPGSFTRRAAAIVLGLAVLVPSCDGGSDDRLMVVASFYSLAFAAEQVGGPDVEVIDLTPPGSEAHDVELSFRDRALLGRADLVVYLGEIGFQPQIERAIPDAEGEVVVAAPSIERDDPHVWLDPQLFAEMSERVAEGYARADEDGADAYRARAEKLQDRLQTLNERYESTLANCRLDTILVTHDAFGYLGDRYGLEQVGLAGVSPEGEPTADSLVHADDLIREGVVEAIFYEETEEGKRIAETVGEDLVIPALPLATLESRPARGNYLTVMQANLDSLAEGLGCG
jgi:zinc transport system substrate-binding protein